MPTEMVRHWFREINRDYGANHKFLSWLLTLNCGADIKTHCKGFLSFTGYVKAGELESYRRPTLPLYTGIMWTTYSKYVCSDNTQF